ncbi:Os02g0784200 [Oryza sativa Japonica Group]|jgi:hypothetical protein|uniref:Os02g0784200 protein n=1 Tax=Oryza sativa subsp. japonica TaxID=39947 RepID=A0A0N7KG78_ORYSJ|nr:Os02g0784200 [Oryza sativa Japonica Group]
MLPWTWRKEVEAAWAVCREPRPIFSTPELTHSTLLSVHRSHSLLLHQLYCPQSPYQVVPVLSPVALPVPPPPQPGLLVSAAVMVVDGPASCAVVLSLVPQHAPEDEIARARLLLRSPLRRARHYRVREQQCRLG